MSIQCVRWAYWYFYSLAVFDTVWIPESNCSSIICMEIKVVQCAQRLLSQQTRIDMVIKTISSLCWKKLLQNKFFWTENIQNHFFSKKIINSRNCDIELFNVGMLINASVAFQRKNMDKISLQRQNGLNELECILIRLKTLLFKCRRIFH